MEPQSPHFSADAETCRICRCEGTPDDPLYYPCRCNGSIKFVHQNCLMEWLSHSQKKYCELCKTHFRFTKMYNTDMPRSLPPRVFVKHAAIYLARNAAVWMRALLVASIWLCWLPYFMRRLWTFLFWVSDDGVDGLFITSPRSQHINGRDIAILQKFAICPSSPLTALHFCPPISQFSHAVYEQVVASSQYGGSYPSTSSYSMSERLFFGLLRFFFPGPASRAEMSALNPNAFACPDDSSSVLGGVSFLRNITKYPYVNKAIITVLEGQLITITVILSFILIILVRDYVVQHQPEINARDVAQEAAAQEAAAQQAVVAPAADNDNGNLIPHPDTDIDADDAEHESITIHRLFPDNPDEDDHLHPEILRHRILLKQYTIWHLAGQLQTHEPACMDTEYFRLVDICIQAILVAHNLENSSLLLKSHTKVDYYSTTRESLDNYIRLLIKNKGNLVDVLTDAATSSIPSDPLLIIALREHLDANNLVLFPETILPETFEEMEAGKIVEAEVGNSGPSNVAASTTNSSLAQADPASSSLGLPDAKYERPVHENGPLNSSEAARIKDKGKTKAILEVPNGVGDEGFIRLLESNAKMRNKPSSDSSSRPRSQSDGPVLRDNISPLGNGSWAFGPSASPSQHDSLSETSTTSGIAGPSSWSFSALESQPLFARTRDDETPFGDSSPPRHNSGHSRVQSENGSNGSRLMSTIGLDDSDNSDWESISDEQGNDQVARPVEQSRSDNEDMFYERSNNMRSTPNENSDQDSTPGETEMTEIFRNLDQSTHDQLRLETEIMNHFTAPLENHRRPVIIEPTDHIEHVEDVEDAESESDMEYGTEPRHAGEIDGEGRNPRNVPMALDGRDGNDSSRDSSQERQRNEETQGQQHAANLPGILAEFMWGDLDDDDDDLDVPADVDNDDGGWFDAVPDAEDPAANDGAAGEGEIFDNDEFDGIMELLGMAGPIFGLFQNAMFCICLVLISLIVCVVLPYNIGRITSWFIASPLRLVRMVFFLVSIIQDMAAMVGGIATYLLSSPIYYISMSSGWLKPDSSLVHVLQGSWNLSSQAFARSQGLFWGSGSRPTELQTFTVISHASLISIKAAITSVFMFAFQLAQAVGTACWKSGAVLAHPTNWDFAYSLSTAKDSLSHIPQIFHTINFQTVAALLKNPSMWIINIGTPENYANLDPNLIHWSGWDRFLVITIGYLSITATSALYLNQNLSWLSSLLGEEVEDILFEALTQAGGVMKVLVIISIEMLVFPLYCGILVDAVLLPLFRDATMQSRFDFTMQNPMTSIFIHWFVGTGYMFHFALFVSMCRKIMRKGVLYFIRDPDDPEFHPIRDVLERKFFAQVRKIMFSALVYGALIVVCLGGVVWGISLSCMDIFPIHYSSNEPVLEFPIDLLFYNFLMPAAVKFFKPDSGILTMYTWCFRRSARMLRLTWYLFGERRIDEEGTLRGVGGKHLPWYKTMTLEVVKNQVVPIKMKAFFCQAFPKPRPTSESKLQSLSERKQELVAAGRLVPDGQFTRVPASDYVRLVRGRSVFIPVEERDILRPFVAPPGSDIVTSHYQLVYLPPRFYLRILAFIVCLWTFAAITGVTLSIIPLTVGRYIFTALLPDHVRTNDIYAFTIGVYALCSFGWILHRIKDATRHGQNAIAMLKTTLADPEFPTWVVAMVSKGAKLVYTYAILLLVFPILAALLVELYLLIPLHTYFYPSKDPTNRHVIPVIQTWTLGILYLKLGSRIITRRYGNSRFGRAIRAVMNRGIYNPRVRLFTRAFALPGIALSLAAMAAPPMLMQFTISTNVLAPTSNDASAQAFMYRMSYPLAAMWMALLVGLNAFFGVANNWSAKIRDEAYLVGARLHNLGEPKAGRGQWRTGQE
ncbi:hypothetical protein Cpir12675_001240 [Ceratocystis pirilliformis]|uniref:RING-type E3 ubiquitin transferase n=1 Tax=Ceratocystis pirilliformis TaxID=259994 RepID=A0ABR3ZI57_9PEZI